MKFNRLISIAMLSVALLFSVVGASAQNITKSILAEYFTNASNGTASSMNPGNMTYFMSNLNATNPVIPIVYHYVYNYDNTYYADAIFSGLSSTARANINNRFNNSSPTAYEHFVAGGNKVSTWSNQTDMKSAIASAKGTGKSTYEITSTLYLDGDSVRVDATVKSSAAFAGKRLFVVLCEAYHWYNQAGTNGEKNFYFVARDFMINANDGYALINAPANGTVAKSYATYLNPEWYPTMLYAVVFVQDSTTKEVYQAAISTMPSLTGVTSIPRVGATINQDPSYNLIERSQEFTKKVTIRNANNFEMTCKVLMGGSLPETWQAQLSSNLVTIPANSNVDVDITINPGEAAGYASIDLGIFPVGLNDAFPMPLYHSEYFMTNKIKFAVFTGTSIVNSYYGALNDLYHAYSIANFNESYQRETAVIPLNEITLTKFPTSNYDCIALYSDGLLADSETGVSLFMNGGYATEIITMVKEMLNAGKKVWISSWMDHWMGLQSEDSDIVDFFENYIGVDITNTPEGNPYYTLAFGENGYLNFYNFEVNGIDGDIIGSGMNVNATQLTSEWSAATFYTCPLTPRDGSEAIPFCFMNYDTDQYLGIHKKYGNGKLVYTTVGVEGMSTEQSRTDFLDRILGWLDPLGEVGPRIISDINDITFLDMELGQTETQKVKITNSGTEPLVITRYETVGTNAGMFELIPPFVQDVTIQPEQSMEITVQFVANNSGSMDATLRFTSNAKNAPTFDILMLAEVKSTGTGPQITLDVNEIDFGTITPKVEATQTLKINSTGNEPLIITMVDFEDSRGVFDYADGTSFPITIAKGKSYNLGLTAKNNRENDTYNVNMTITSNAKNTPALLVLLKSKTGVNDVKEGTTPDGLFSMTASPNPLSEKSVITMNLAGNAAKNVSVYVIDVTGAKVADVYNSVIAPGASVDADFNAAALASGKYFVIANVNGTLVQVPVIINK